MMIGAMDESTEKTRPENGDGCIINLRHELTHAVAHG